jgi:hypothetical protein
MDTHDIALLSAGVVGSLVAVVHGGLTQRLMVRPMLALPAGQLSRPVRRLVAALLQFSTFNWFLGGLALIAVAFASGRDVKLAIGLLVGSSYLFGAAGNLWATRGRHPGWVLYGIATLAIGYGLAGA